MVKCWSGKIPGNFSLAKILPGKIKAGVFPVYVPGESYRQALYLRKSPYRNKVVQKVHGGLVPEGVEEIQSFVVEGNGIKPGFVQVYEK